MYKHDDAKSYLYGYSRNRRYEHADKHYVVKCAYIVWDPSAVMIEAVGAPVAKLAVLGTLNHMRLTDTAVEVCLRPDKFNTTTVV